MGGKDVGLYGAGHAVDCGAAAEETTPAKKLGEDARTE